jgi:hypothetical protein
MRRSDGRSFKIPGRLIQVTDPVVFGREVGYRTTELVDLMTRFWSTHEKDATHFPSYKAPANGEAELPYHTSLTISLARDGDNNIGTEVVCQFCNKKFQKADMRQHIGNIFQIQFTDPY